MRAWTIWYPYQAFEGAWQVLVSAAAHGQLFVVDRVRDELQKQVPDLVIFFDKYAANWHSVTLDDAELESALRGLEVDLAAGKIIKQYKIQNIKKYIDVADPTLVLHAQVYGHVVVSNELSDKNDKKGPKIPDLCALKGVMHANPYQFAAAVGFDFGPT